MAPSALVAFLRQSRVLERRRRPTQSVINRSLKAAWVPSICDFTSTGLAPSTSFNSSSVMRATICSQSSTVAGRPHAMQPSSSPKLRARNRGSPRRRFGNSRIGRVLRPKFAALPVRARVLVHLSAPPPPSNQLPASFSNARADATLTECLESGAVVWRCPQARSRG